MNTLNHDSQITVVAVFHNPGPGSNGWMTSIERKDGSYEWKCSLEPSEGFRQIRLTVEAPDDAVLTCLNTGESERAVNG